jgi:hypothetical protein
MRLRTQWLISSVGGGALAAAALLVFPNALSPSFPPSLDQVMRVFFWPVVLCEHLVGPGPSIGPPNRHLHEGTPVQLLAAVVGLNFTWMFWSSLVFLIIRRHTKRRNRGLGVGH